MDLSYVTPQIIAMGYPSEGFEAYYRNSMEDTQRFLNHYHQGNYKVYNLCSERHYDLGSFDRVSADFTFDDHNPPKFTMIYDFCQDVDQFLSKSKHNVVAIHCKAGKGRTGVMICCYLVYSRYCRSAHEALVYYGEIRTKDRKGVTIPSQIRYVYYFEHFLREQRRLQDSNESSYAGSPLLKGGGPTFY